MNLIDQAFEKAVEVLRMNVTERGFSACSLAHDSDPNSNYRSVWARDSALTALWSFPLRDKELTEAGRRSIETIFDAQAESGHLPNYVDVASGVPEYGGIGNIAGIDGAMWMVLATHQYWKLNNDDSFVLEHWTHLRRTMKFLRAMDANNCGLLEVPEASDWMDLFPRSYHVLYDEILWYRANHRFAEMCGLTNEAPGLYERRAERIKTILNDEFWPNPETINDPNTSYAKTQFSLGRAKYLLSQISPFAFSWRCDVFANIMAYLYGVIDEQRATRIWRFLRQICIDKPYPVQVLYPAIQPGQPEWRDYFLVNLLNLPHHYHNGGIWPFVGGLWVRFLDQLGKREHAAQALQSLAEFCHEGVDDPWEFNEWGHGQTGKPMGKPYQAWSAASYVAAYLALQGEASILVDRDREASESQELSRT